MTFLELCNQAIRDGDVSGGTMSDVTGQSGERGDVVTWVARAYRDICRKVDTWKFLRSSFELDVDNTSQIWPLTAASDTRLALAPALDAGASSTADAPFHYWYVDTFRIYRESAGVATQQIFPVLDYEVFRNRWLLGATQSGPPSVFTVRPDDSAIILGPKPDANYIITGDYQRRAKAFVAATDAPLFEDEFHDAIVWGAIKYLAVKRQDAGQYTAAEREFDRVYGDLEKKHLPEICVAGPLA